MADLHERLERLAEGAPQRVPSSDLWRRGRGYGRRKALAQTLVALSCLVLVLVVGTTWVDLTPDRQEVAADPEAKTWLPDELFTPDPWLRSTTDRDGPPGRLVALVPGEHRSLFSSEQGFYGVSGETGEYRFLNLPELAQGDALQGPNGVISLSPDGTKVAYWLAGRGTKNFSSVSGFAVYDLVTGTSFRHHIDSTYGLDGYGIAWTENSAWFEYFVWSDDHSGNGGAADAAAPLIWDFGSRVVHTYEDGGLVDVSNSASVTPGFLAAAGQGYRWYLDNTENSIRVRPSLKTQAAPYLSPDLSRIGGVNVDSTNDELGKLQPLVIGEVKPGGGPVEMRKIPSFGATQMLGWRDNSHLVARGAGNIVYSVDSVSGDVETVMSLKDPEGPILLATDLLGSPIRAGVEPTAPPNTWMLIGVAAAVAALGLWIWRRRVRV